MILDMFGNEIREGDYIAYAELSCKTRAVQSIYRVIEIGKTVICLCVESSGFAKGYSKKLQCVGEKAIKLNDYKEKKND